MGLNIAGIQNILELWQLGYLKNSKKIIEMGSQELHLKSNDFERYGTKSLSASPWTTDKPCFRQILTFF